MKAISKEILKKYHCFETIEMAKEFFGDTTDTEITFYETFLKQTDYLAMKLAEGLITRDDKKAEFDARDFARQEINRLQSEQKVIN